MSTFKTQQKRPVLATLALIQTDIRHRHHGGMSKKTPPPIELQIPATVTTLLLSGVYSSFYIFQVVC